MGRVIFVGIIGSFQKETVKILKYAIQYVCMLNHIWWC